jgi:hypothetical protein
VTAGVLLAARSLSEQLGVPQPSVGEILRLTGATRSRAYEIKDALEAVLPTLARPPGRPRVEPAPGPANVPDLVGIAVEMILFMKRNPGCVQSGARDHYADCYRRFVLELRERHADVPATEFAAAITIPLGTLEDWMRASALDDAASEPHGSAGHGATDAREPPAGAEIGDIRPTSGQNAQHAGVEVGEAPPTTGQDARPAGAEVGDPRPTAGHGARHADSEVGEPRPTAGQGARHADTEVGESPPTAGQGARHADAKIGEPRPTPGQDARHAGAEIGIPRPIVGQDARHAQIETVLTAYRLWRGTFGGFCAHVRRDHRLELGNTLIASILFEHGARRPARRDGRSRDDEALRESFETFFPGAQWVGDGKQLAIVIDGKTFHRNLELVVDAATDAAVGISVRHEEDSAAVVQAFTQGVAATGGTPLALLLDNRPSNHTPEVDAALDDTLRIRATPGRAQNKAHVEGSFGLFAQKVPPIDLDTRDLDALATSVADLVATTFFRGLNRAPRRDRAGKTRAELYDQLVTPEQYEAACAALRDRLRKQELARQTRAARRDPIIAALLDDAFARLSLLDPERHFRDAIACYPREAIVDAIAIFSGKRTAGTLPDGVDARYLLGIVRNLHHRHEAEPITEALIRERLSARDRFLAPLVAERDSILAANANDVGAALIALVDRLAGAERTIDRHLWLDAAADLVAPHPPDVRIALAKRAARRIHATFELSTRDRAHLERALLRRLWPLT